MALSPSADPRHPLHRKLSKALRDHVAAELRARGLEPTPEGALDLPAAGRRCEAVKRIKIIICAHIAKALPPCELDEHNEAQQRIDFGAGEIWTAGTKREILSADLSCAVEAHLRGEPEGDHDQENECGEYRSTDHGRETDDAHWIEKALAYHARHSRALHSAGMCAQPEKPRSSILVHSIDADGNVMRSRRQEVAP